MARKSPFPLLQIVMPAAMGLLYHYFARPQMLKPGTYLGESQRRLPGDEIIVAPAYQATRAINIDAPPEAVWPWIAQLGRDGSGFYGLDALSNSGIPSVAYLRNDLPAPAPNMPLDNGYRILEVEPNRMLLYAGFDLPTPIGQPMEQTVLFLLERRRDGSTRLITRVRGYTYGALGPVFSYLYEIVDFVQGVMQLENLRQRAELMAHLTSSSSTSPSAPSAPASSS